MKTNKSTKKPVTYTYESADGSTYTLRSGEDDVTIKLIRFLEESDRQFEIDERNQADILDWKFRNAQIAYEEQGGLLEDSPLERIPDPNADILQILYGDEDDEDEGKEDSLLDRLEDAMDLLTENQRDLIYELYGQQRSIIDIARSKNVTEGAIRKRRNRILRQLAKLTKLG